MNLKGVIDGGIEQAALVFLPIRKYICDVRALSMATFYVAGLIDPYPDQPAYVPVNVGVCVQVASP